MGARFWLGPGFLANRSLCWLWLKFGPSPVSLVPETQTFYGNAFKPPCFRDSWRPTENPQAFFGNHRFDVQASESPLATVPINRTLRYTGIAWSTTPLPQLGWNSGRMSGAGLRGEQSRVRAVVCPQCKQSITEKCDDSMPDRSGCRLQEMSGIFNLSPEKRHRRLPEARRHTTQAASGQRKEVVEVDEDWTLVGGPTSGCV